MTAARYKIFMPSTTKNDQILISIILCDCARITPYPKLFKRVVVDKSLLNQTYGSAISVSQYACAVADD
jgi:hypothetical protein